jgi:hypothetical protein
MVGLDWYDRFFQFKIRVDGNQSSLEYRKLVDVYLSLHKLKIEKGVKSRNTIRR